MQFTLPVGSPRPTAQRSHAPDLTVQTNTGGDEYVRCRGRHDQGQLPLTRWAEQIDGGGSCGRLGSPARQATLELEMPVLVQSGEHLAAGDGDSACGACEPVADMS